MTSAKKVLPKKMDGVVLFLHLIVIERTMNSSTEHPYFSFRKVLSQINMEQRTIHLYLQMIDGGILELLLTK